jgi:hypothetical protein
MDALRVIAFAATTILASVALSPSPTAAGLAGLLVALQLHPRLFSRKANDLISPWGASTLGAVISHTRAATNALQGSVLSMVVLTIVSAAVSVIPIATVYFDARFISKGHRYSWYRLAAFPALWASVWGVISVLTPVGRLLHGVL